MDINLIETWVSLVFAVISLIIGSTVLKRTAGKLRTSIIFLISAFVVIVIKDILKIINFSLFDIEIIRNSASILVVFLILISIVNMKRMINGIDHKYRK